MFDGTVHLSRNKTKGGKGFVSRQPCLEGIYYSQ
jgi:hypothetical protein